MRTLFLAVAAIFAAAGPLQAAEPMKVVATLSTFADLVKQVGGDRVDVSQVASPRFNPHQIEPKPSDVLRVKRAALFVHTGLDLELWRGPLVDAAGNPKVRPGSEGNLDLSEGVKLLEIPEGPVSRSEGDIHIYGNPHYWLDPNNIRIMAQSIARKLEELDPDGAPEFRRNLAAFLEKLDRKIPEWKAAVEPSRGQEIIAYHNEWPYLMEFLGIEAQQFLEPKPGIPPTPKQLVFLEKYIGEKEIRVIAQPTFYSQAAAKKLAAATGAAVVILCQNVGELPEAKDYFSFMDYNVQELVKGFSR
jgi:ABC-type Zn uptake system ZnuABC Zn-binding protein ZnuA